MFLPRCTLGFTTVHSLSLNFCVSASRLSRSEPFAIAHMKLMKDDDTTIEDGMHELFVYKVRILMIV